jgi:hypothetical protein
MSDRSSALAPVSGGELVELGRGLELRPDWYPQVQGHPVDAYLSRLDARSSRQVQASALEQLVQRVLGIRTEPQQREDLGLRYRFPWHLVRPQQAGRIRQALADPDPVTGSRYALATQNRMLVAFRRVLKECWRLGYLSADDYARAVDLPAFRGERLPRGRAVSEGELRSLFLACAQDPGPAGRRDAALFTLLRAGLRRAEVA